MRIGGLPGWGMVAAVCAAIVAGTAQAGAAGGAGTASGAAAGIGGSARSLAMGGAGMADLSEPGAIWVNPARLAGLRSPEAGFMHGTWVEGVAVDQLAIAGPTRWGAFGGGVSLLGMGSIQSYDSSGAEAGSFSPGEQSYSLGWAWPGGMWSAGAAVSYYRSELASDAHASAWSGDAGVSVTPSPIVTAAVSVQHLGTGLDYGGKSASLPMTIRGGAAVSPANLGLVVAADAVKPSDGNVSIRAGAEKSFALRGDVTALVRAGYRTGAPTGGMGGLAAGAEVFWHPESGFGGFSHPAPDVAERQYPVQGLRISYAWTPMGELGDAHWFAVALSF